MKRKNHSYALLKNFYTTYSFSNLVLEYKRPSHWLPRTEDSCSVSRTSTAEANPLSIQDLNPFPFFLVCLQFSGTHFQMAKQVENQWYVGPPATGKTRTVQSLYPDAYHANLEDTFWTGYNNQETIVIHDLRPSAINSETGQFFENLAMGLPVVLRRKHKSGLEIRAKRVIVTSNFTIEDCFIVESNDIKPLFQIIQS